jgi:hypothetical protein
MGIGVEVLASTVQEMVPTYAEMFLVWNPLIDIMLRGGRVERGRLEAPFKEFSVVTGGPGDVTQVKGGSEVIEGGRNENTAKGNTYAARHIYAWDIPLLDLATTNTKTEIGNLIKRYFETALADFQQRVERQMLVGDGVNVGGYLTFNGNTTYTPLSGSARTGVFSYAAKASQTSTVFNLPKAGAGTSPTTGWYNQYGNITSFRANGKKSMRKIVWACNRQGAKTFGGIDAIFSDNESFENYMDILDEQVRINDPKDLKQGDRVMPADDRPTVMFGNAMMYQCEQLERAATAFSGTTAADGLMYFINSRCWHAYTQGADKDKETNGDFALRGPFRIPDQDMVRAEYVSHMGMYSDQLRGQGVLTGTALE